jgi:8-oxo-dGTP diphosphatase
MPMIGVGGVVIRDGRALLIRRGSEPLKGEWSIPGGMLEVGETIAEGVARELLEETGLAVRVLDLIEVFERLFHESEVNLPPAAKVQPKSQGIAGPDTPGESETSQRPLYHFVILDYLCAAPEGNPKAGGDVTDVAFAAEDELAMFSLTPTATRVIRKAFALARQSAK